MSGRVLVAWGDLTQLAVDVVGYSTDRRFNPGQLASAFAEHVRWMQPALDALLARLGGIAEPFSAHWLPSPEPGCDGRAPSPRGVVVTVSVGRGMPAPARAALAVRTSVEVATRALAADRCAPRPWTVALPAFLTGAGGSRHDRLRVAIPQVETALELVRAEPDLDVAFVAYTEGTYRVFLEARRAVLERRPELAPPPAPEPDPRLVGALRRGECVVFLGSGVSLGAGLPSWSALVDRLADALSIPKAARRGDLDYLLDLAQWYRDEGASPSIEEIVARGFTAVGSGARPTLAHYQLASLPARVFATTNWDDLTEAALRALRRPPERIVFEPDVARTGGPDGRFVVKLHGCAAAGSRIVLSRDDYDAFFREHPALALLLEGLLLNQSFFFVGYGLRDPDFRQLHSRVAALLQSAKRPAFATTFDEASHARRQWRAKHVELLPLPGGAPHEKARALHALLDRLGELTADDPGLFFATDTPAPSSPAVAALRERLLACTEDLVAACASSAAGSARDARLLAELLRFYAARGYRGFQIGEVGALFAALSLHADLSREEKRALVLSALRYTESVAEAKQLVAALALLES